MTLKQLDASIFWLNIHSKFYTRVPKKKKKVSEFSSIRSQVSEHRHARLPMFSFILTQCRKARYIETTS
jgi:hypothetical protein